MTRASGAVCATFHAGERALQAEAGLAERMEEIGPKVIRDFMPEQHRELFEQLPFMLLGVVDTEGDPRAILLAGAPGFTHALDEHTLQLRYAWASDAEAIAELAAGHAVGLLGLQPHTRRRNRANGFLEEQRPGVLRVHVLQSFGNCPKYITPRKVRFEASSAASVLSVETQLLSPAAQAIVRSADTFFIASSAAPERVAVSAPYGVDISHRGGPAGFVTVTEEAGAQVLTFPDYQGNFFFNTLGNLAMHPRAGVLFVDFESRAVLALQTDVEIIGGAEGREIRLRVRRGRLTRGAVPLVI